MSSLGNPNLKLQLLCAVGAAIVITLAPTGAEASSRSCTVNWLNGACGPILHERGGESGQQPAIVRGKLANDSQGGDARAEEDNTPAGDDTGHGGHGDEDHGEGGHGDGGHGDGDHGGSDTGGCQGAGGGNCGNGQGGGGGNGTGNEGEGGGGAGGTDPGGDDGHPGDSGNHGDGGNACSIAGKTAFHSCGK